MANYLSELIRWLMTWHGRTLDKQFERQVRQGHTPVAVLYGAKHGESYLVERAPGGKWRLETGEVVSPGQIWKIRNDRVAAGLAY